MVAAMTRKQPPPPPPPPTMVSRKYLIELPANVTRRNLGILFQPHKSVPTELGAQIRAIATSFNHTAQWQKEYGMKKGDLLYKVDGRLVTNMDHSDIIKLLSSCNSLIFEIGQGSPSSGAINNPKTDPSNAVDGKMKGIQLEEMPVPAAPAPVPVPKAKQMQQKAPTKTPTSRGKHHDRTTKPLPGETSSKSERNLLSSIFSPNGNSVDDSMPEYFREVEITSDDCPGLVAIPEGCGADTSHSSSMEFSRDSASVPQQHQNLFPMASPTFSYSVTTANSRGTNGPMSPIGLGIPTSVSIATGNSLMSSIRQEFHASQVNKLKEKYSSDLNPIIGAVNVNSPNNNEQHDMNTFPVRTVQRDPSMESCSVSTMFLSPTQQRRAGMTSPAIPQCSNSNSLSNTPLTTKSQKSEAVSYKDIPIAMLDYKFVRECNSLKEMEKIVAALKSTSPPEFPSLLRMAENRMVELRGSRGVTRTRERLDVCYEGDCDEHASDDLRKGIPTHIHVEIQTDVQSALNGDEFFQEQVSQEDMAENMNDIMIAHAELKGQMEELLRERDVMQESLTSQVNSLEELLQNVKSEMNKQTNASNVKIESLIRAKTEAEMEMQKLRESCASSSSGVEQLTNDLKAKEKEIGNFAAQLYKAQESKRSAMEKAESVKERLQAQVKSLTNQLRVQVKKTQATRTMVELRLRAEYDGKLKRDFALMEELEQKLNSATEDVQVLYQENRFMATEFAKVGMVSSLYCTITHISILNECVSHIQNVSCDLQRFESPEQFRELLKEFAAAEACANALAKALTESESELCVIVHENLRLKAKVDMLEKENHQISSENRELTLQLAAMDKELISLHSELDTYQSRQQNYDKLIKKCKAATELYNRKVYEYKAQIAERGDVVPVEIYKQAVESSSILEISLREKESQVQHLTERIYNLENIIKKTHFNGSSVEPHKSRKPGTACPARGRAALLKKMEKVRHSQDTSSQSKRSALGDFNANSLSRLSTAPFVSTGKENM